MDVLLLKSFVVSKRVSALKYSSVVTQSFSLFVCPWQTVAFLAAPSISYFRPDLYPKRAHSFLSTLSYNVITFFSLLNFPGRN